MSHAVGTNTRTCVAELCVGVIAKATNFPPLMNGSVGIVATSLHATVHKAIRLTRKRPLPKQPINQHIVVITQPHSAR